MRASLFAIWIIATLLAFPEGHDARAADAPDGTPAPVQLAPVEVVGSTPLLGSGIARDKVPAKTDVLNAGDIARTGPPDALRALDQQVAGVNLNDAAGNPLQPALFYHGFQASPLQGSPEGLAVYLNGGRFNSAFGDTVNWDLIPNIAINQLNLVGSNPVFGLNALGGAINIQMKNGFIYQGGEVDLYGGSFGQIGSDLQYGRQDGNVSTYVAGSELHEDGWRDRQTSDQQTFFGDLGGRNDRAELHFSMALANSVLNGPGTSPVQLLDVDPEAQFTAPNQIANKYALANLSGTYQLTDDTALQAVAYYDYFLQRVINGNAPNDTPCNNGSGLLCSAPGIPSTTRGGVPIADFLNGGPYSELDNQTTNTNGYGLSLQATNTRRVFGLPNQLVAGFSFDGSQTMFSGTSLIGGMSTDRTFIGPGIAIDEPGTDSPVRVAVNDAYYGAFMTDTLDLTPRLSVTSSGRFNAADIALSDQTGTALTGNHVYNRFNPSAGATYQLTSWLNVYASYAEANRAPTPAELSCAGPQDSCSLANFFTGDPNLKQVVAHTVEAGLRGSFHPGKDRTITYSVSLFHSDLDDDIAFVNSVTLGRAFFENIGGTRRQGIDAGLQYRDPRWLAYIDYSYTDATYRTGFIEAAGNNPDADPNGNITIHPGDRLPGIPANQVKLGVQCQVTPRWTVGATGIAESGAVLFGDEANLTPRLPGFFTLDLNTSYQMTPHIQFYGLVNNATNAKYYTYGTFSPTASVFIAQAPNATNPRSLSPAAPIGGFGGIRVSF
ncbi:MAG TPA: TonB-dependent receptor [Acetobacteraceae bacterium]|nr:TonB-dependent receptor [Acetobacteraceae bacterium]